MSGRFKCFSVNFGLVQTVYVHLLVCYLNKYRTYFGASCDTYVNFAAQIRKDLILNRWCQHTDAGSDTVQRNKTGMA